MESHRIKGCARVHLLVGGIFCRNYAQFSHVFDDYMPVVDLLLDDCRALGVHGRRLLRDQLRYVTHDEKTYNKQYEQN